MKVKAYTISKYIKNADWGQKKKTKKKTLKKSLN